MKLELFSALATAFFFTSCGDGGVSLHTDNVEGEYYPKNSRASFMMTAEITDESQPAATGMEMTFTSTGNNQGVLSIDGQAGRQATVTYATAETVAFTTDTAQITLNGVSYTPTNQTAVFTEWSYLDVTEPCARTGKNGSFTVRQNQ